jgi:F0F1-type ATP synthase delta subunit
MISLAVAQRYARAMLALAQEENSLDAVAKDFTALATLFGASVELQTVLTAP